MPGTEMGPLSDEEDETEDSSDEHAYDYTADVHPSKLLFAHLAKLLGKSALRCYMIFLKNGLDVRFDYRTMLDSAQASKRIAERLYHGQTGLAPTRFFDFDCCADHFRLNQSLFPDTECYSIFARDSQGRLVKIFDPSTFLATINGGRVVQCRLRLLYGGGGQPSALTLLENEPGLEGVTGGFCTEAWFAEGIVAGPSPNIGRALELLLGVPGAAELESMLDIADNCEIFDRLPVRYRLVSHVGQSPRNRQTLARGGLAGLFCFGNVELGKADAVCSDVIFVTLDPRDGLWSCFLTRDEVSAEALKRDSTPSPDIGAIQSSVSKVGATLEEEAGSVGRRKAGKRKGGGCDADGDDADDWVAEGGFEEEEAEGEGEEEEWCCGVCQLGRRYEKNVPELGPQRRFHRGLDTGEFLKVCGVNTADNRRRVLESIELGMSSFDIESSTCWVREDAKEKVVPVSRSKQRTGMTAYQEAKLIGYADSYGECSGAAGEDGGDAYHYKMIAADGGGVKGMISSFVEHLHERRKVLAARRAALLAPLYEYIDRAELVYNKHLEGEGEDQETIYYTFSASVFGQFRRNLDRISTELVVTSFNGAAYDMPLIYKYLAAELRDGGMSLKILKSGATINRMSWRTSDGGKIIFVDLLAMTAPGTSLAGMAKQVGLTTRKMSFPFGEWTDMEYLKKTSLPRDRASWWNHLSQSSPPQEDIDDAIRDFERRGCKNLFAYLAAYLEIDVILLAKSGIRLLREMAARFELHPYGAGKFTISSYSFEVVQKQLVRQKNVACYSPTHPLIYASCKASSCGGLTQVFLHEAGQASEYKKAKEGDLDEDPTRVVYTDFVSLYGHCGTLPLPFGPAVTMNLVDGALHPATRAFDSTGRLMETEEALAVQHMASVEFKDALFFFSRFTAGPGQIGYGRTSKSRPDACVIVAEGEWEVINYHENHHYLPSSEHCHEESCPDHVEGDLKARNRETCDVDEFNLGLAQALTDAGVVKIRYSARSSCHFFHGRLAGEEAVMDTTGEGFVVPPSWTRGPLYQSELVSKIVDGSASGLVVFKAGEETAEDECSKVTGMCLQRDSVSPQEVGDVAIRLEMDRVRLVRRRNESQTDHLARVRRAAVNNIERRGRGPYTLLRKHFNGTQAMTVHQFRWLLEERGLTNYTIVHYIHYETRSYLTGFLKSLLQRRHDLTLAGLKRSLEGHVLKLYLNSFYGFCMMERSTFSNHSFSKESNLRKNLRNPKERKRIRSLTLAGYDTGRSTASGNGHDVELWYLVERDRLEAENVNLSQIASFILGWSRTLFYGAIKSLLNVLDPASARLCYCDTDSLIFELRRATFEECVKPGLEKEFAELKKQMFEDPDAPLSQSGKLGTEGVYRRARFTGVKNYILEKFVAPESSEERFEIRAKGISKSVRDRMTEDDFAVDNKTAKYFSNLSLKATLGGEVALVVKSRIAASAINMKRTMHEDRVHTSGFE